MISSKGLALYFSFKLSQFCDNIHVWPCVAMCTLFICVCKCTSPPNCIMVVIPQVFSFPILTCNSPPAIQLFKLLHKYRPETKAMKKERLRSTAEKKSEGAESTPGKKPITLKYGINNITRLIEQKKATLVVISHDVDPIEVSRLTHSSQVTVHCMIELVQETKSSQQGNLCLSRLQYYQHCSSANDDDIQNSSQSYWCVYMCRLLYSCLPCVARWISPTALLKAKHDWESWSIRRQPRQSVLQE